MIRIWPDFTEKRKLRNGLCWTAKFHSFNQRNNDLYYIITLYDKFEENSTPYKRFGTIIMEPIENTNKLSITEISTYLLEQLERSAEKGETNIPDHILWKGIGQEDIDKL